MERQGQLITMYKIVKVPLYKEGRNHMNTNTVFYIEQKKHKRNTAGAKAPEDIATLCHMRGYTKVEFMRYPKGKSVLYQKIWVQLVGNYQWRKLLRMVHVDDVVIFQHPSYGKRTAMKWIRRIQKQKKCKFIALIHDLESLRGGIAGILETNEKANEIGDNHLLKCFDVIICHNESMKQYLLGQGFAEDKLVCLEIFDYLSDCNEIEWKKGEMPSIAIAGNLASGKCGYIYKISERKHNNNLTVNLFGNNYEGERATAHMIWHGSFKPDELPNHLKGDFGLVWDGTEAYTCAGNTGQYLRYNNPHKTSLYLSSGLPVIIWKQAAMANFVLDNGVGLAIESLYDLEDTISEVTSEEYETLCRNARNISEKLHDGYYFYKALDEALNRCYGFSNGEYKS